MPLLIDPFQPVPEDEEDSPSLLEGFIVGFEGDSHLSAEETGSELSPPPTGFERGRKAG